MFSKTRTLRGIGVIAVAMLSSYAAFAQAQKANAPATIEQITALQRQVLVAELNKKLREANATDKGNAGGGAATFPSAPIPGGAITALPSPARKKAAPSTPAVPKEDVRVLAIAGVGSNLQATLNNGQTVKVGQKFSRNGDTWEVVRMNSSSVQFKQCTPDKGCKDITLPVVSS